MRLLTPLLAAVVLAHASSSSDHSTTTTTEAPSTNSTASITTTTGQPKPIYKTEHAGDKKEHKAHHHHHHKHHHKKAAKVAHDAVATNMTAHDDAFGVPAPCPDGFVWGKDGRCEDFNECWAHKYVCPTDAHCINTKGSYLCDCGPRQEYRDGECRPTKENARDSKTCFLEYPLQFLEYGHGQGKASEKVFPHQTYNPGFVPKGNTGIAACKESCRKDFRCEAAVVKRDEDNEKTNLCYHRLLRLDDGRPPVNSVLHNLKEDHDAVTFVKAKCGSCCEYPDTDMEGTPLVKVSASSAQDCCSTASLVVGAVAAVYRPKDIAYDEKRNCRIYGNKAPAPAPAKGGHGKRGWGGPPPPRKGYEGPVDPMDSFFDKEGSTTVIPGPCRNAYKFYVDAGKDCCTVYRDTFLPQSFSPDDNVVRLELPPTLLQEKLNMQAMPVDAKVFSLHTARRDCCEYCKQHDGCTGAQLVSGRCRLFMNEIAENDLKTLFLINSATPGAETDFSAETDLLLRTNTNCDDTNCIVPAVKPLDNRADARETLDFDFVDKQDKITFFRTIFRQCWSDCKSRDGCHAVTLSLEDGKKGGGGRRKRSRSNPELRCRFFNDVPPVGVGQLELERDFYATSIFKTNPDWTCSPPLEVQEPVGP